VRIGADLRVLSVGYTVMRLCGSRMAGSLAGRAGKTGWSNVAPAWGAAVDGAVLVLTKPVSCSAPHQPAGCASAVIGRLLLAAVGDPCRGVLICAPKGGVHYGQHLVGGRPGGAGLVEVAE
jgi:hypothetical protein